ncbi:HAD family hydrolase [Nitrospirillum amazonense]|nr:HAD family hydrolase [Nitrospirillum amazonense]
MMTAMIDSLDPAAISGGPSLGDQALHEAIMAAGAVSFGFYGTLFHRATPSPDAVFDMLGRRYSMSGFSAQRKAAQAEALDRAHKAGRREITLAGIYDCLALEPTLAASIKAAEVSLELDLLCPDPIAIAALRQALALGRRVLIIADSYMGRAFVRDALGRHGLDSIALFISSDCNLTARDGDLFDLAIDYLQLPRERVLHVGCDLQGDVAQARAKGLATAHHQGHDQGNGKSLGPVIPVSAALPAGTLPPRDLGYRVAGPAAVGFLNWIERQAKLDDIRHLLFCSRGGDLLERLVQESPGLWSLPPCSFLPGSRTAFDLAAMDDLNFADYLPFLISRSDGLAPFEVLERIGVPAPAPEVMKKYELGDEIRLSPAVHPRLRGFLFEYRFEILKVCRRNRRALFTFMRNLRLAAGTPVALVDMGWDGATQEAFETALSGMVDLSVHGYSFGLTGDEDSRRRQRARRMTALFTDTDVAPAILRRLHANRASVGLLFDARSQVAIGLEATGNGVRGVEDVRWHADAATGAAISAMVDGAMAFVRDYAAGLTAGAVRPPALEMAWPLVQLLDRPASFAEDLRAQADFDPWTASRHPWQAG